jgi:HAD superfamily hydrolase (TIGR01509 family)
MTLLIFDCDGVLVDSEVLAHQALLDMLIPLGLTMTLAESFRVFAGRSLKDAVVLIEQRIGRAIPDDIGQRHRDMLFDRFRALLRSVTGVEDAIRALPYPRCAASSSSPDRLHLALDVTGLAPLFGAHVFSATQVENGKPAPDLFLLAAHTMGVEPIHCVVIEDSTLGVQAGLAAGMRVIGFAGASHATEELARRLAAAGAHRVIRAMNDLPACVDALKMRESLE